MVAVSGWLIELVTVGAPTILASIPLFAWLGRKWIEQHLQFRLEAFKAEQQREIERLKAEQQKDIEQFKAAQGIDIERLRHQLASRISKIHEKEFEILPQAWLMLHEAHGSAGRLMNPFRGWSDFVNLSETQKNELLDDAQLPPSRKEELLKTTDKDEAKEVLVQIEVQSASEKQRLFHNFLIEHRIFMTQELDKKFGEVDDALLGALINYNIGRDAHNREMQHSAFNATRTLKATIDEIEQLVKSRLRYDEA